MYSVLLKSTNGDDFKLRFLCTTPQELAHTLTYIVDTFDLSKLSVKVLSFRKS